MKSSRVASESIEDVIASAPASVAELYALRPSPDRVWLGIAPKVALTDDEGNEAGTGFDETREQVLSVRGRPIVAAEWRRATLAEVVTDPDRLEELKAKGFKLDQPRDLLLVRTDGDSQPTVFVFWQHARLLGVAAIGNEVKMAQLSSRSHVTVK